MSREAVTSQPPSRGFYVTRRYSGYRHQALVMLGHAADQAAGVQRLRFQSRCIQSS